MPEGPLGGPRPFAVEKENVTIRLKTDESIHEATISAANGHVIQGDLKPFFSISSVYEMDLPVHGSNETIHTVNIEIEDSEGYVDMKDVLLLMNNLNDSIEDTLFPSRVEIIPNINVNRAFVESSLYPKLLIKFSSSRGTEDEFNKSVNVLVSDAPELLRVERFDQSDGSNIAIAVSDGIGLRECMNIASSITGPAGKRTTDVEFDAIGVDMEDE